MRNTFCSLALVFFFLAAGIGTLGFWYYSAQKERIRLQSEHQLSAIAGLKVDEISRWRKERLADAHILMDTPFIGRLVWQCFESTGECSPMQEIRRWMGDYRDRYDYYAVLLVDADGIMRLSLPEGEQVDEGLLELIPEAIRTREPILSDIEKSDIVTDIHLDLVIPLLRTDQPDRPPIGALILRIDPNKFLYPLIRSWPTQSPSAESLLVRREGSEIVFLNELRHRKDPALSLHLPLSQTKTPAVMAASGIEGTVAGIDYRGTPVLAATMPVPGTPWYLVAKVDVDEVYATAHDRALLISFLTALMIAGAGVTLGLIWSYQRSQLYLEQYKTEAEKRELAQRYEHLTRNANDIILLTDVDGKIAEANQRASSAYGYFPDELPGRNMRDLATDETVVTAEALMRSAGEQDGFVFEGVHHRKDGTRFPVEISTRVVKLTGTSFYLMIIRDITERKRAEESLKEAHDTLEGRVRERTADLEVMNERLKQEIHVRVRAQQELRAVTSRLAETEEAERRRLARELHDRVGQNLTALNFNTTTIKNLLSSEASEEAISRLEDSLKLVEDTVVCARDVMSDLRPPLLDDYGLAAALRWYCREFSKRSGVPTDLECEGQMPRLAPSVEIALFRIAQEALMNVMRHARASRVRVGLEATDDAVCMSFADNGVGFDPAAAASPRTQQSGWGMLSMRERAEMVGGNLRVDSAPGGGTHITVEVTR